MTISKSESIHSRWYLGIWTWNSNGSAVHFLFVTRLPHCLFQWISLSILVWKYWSHKQMGVPMHLQIFNVLDSGNLFVPLVLARQASVWCAAFEWTCLEKVLPGLLHIRLRQTNRSLQSVSLSTSGFCIQAFKTSLYRPSSVISIDFAVWHIGESWSHFGPVDFYLSHMKLLLVITYGVSTGNRNANPMGCFLHRVD